MAGIDDDYLQKLYEEDKILREDISWEPENPEIGRYTASARVVTVNSNEPLIFYAERWGTGEFSFVLRYGTNMIRRWDDSPHPTVNGPHKHKYKNLETYEEIAYEVDDIDNSDVNQGLSDALDQFRIELGSYSTEELDV